MPRGLDALNYACYQDARFMVVGTPSGKRGSRFGERAQGSKRRDQCLSHVVHAQPVTGDGLADRRPLRILAASLKASPSAVPGNTRVKEPHWRKIEERGQSHAASGWLTQPPLDPSSDADDAQTDATKRFKGDAAAQKALAHMSRCH